MKSDTLFLNSDLLTKNANLENCVICRNITNVKINTPIVERSFYVEGVGQLCRSCYLEAYEIKSNKK